MFVYIKKDVFTPGSHCKRPFTKIREALHCAEQDFSQNSKLEISWETDRFIVRVRGHEMAVIVELDDAQ